MFPASVLLLVDRSLDLAVCLHHPWTYKALMHDVLGMSMNRLKIEVSVDDDPSTGAASSSAPPKTQQRKYDLSPDTDDFWMEYGQVSFEKVMGLS